MNYYDEILLKIDSLISSNENSKAIEIIKDELKQPYIPKEFEDKLKKLYNQIAPTNNTRLINDDLLEEYLFSSKEKQLIAVDYLNGKNLREYIDICNKYLSSDAYLNAKVLLVDSLIRQEISEEINMINDGIEYCFIPKYLLPIEESDGYLSGYKYLNDVYMKEPSKLKLALDILYKELIMLLPINQDKQEGLYIAKDIETYINKAFEA